MEAVTDLIDKDFNSNLLNIIGITKGWYNNGQLEGLKQEDVKEIFKDKDNFYFKKLFRVNATRGFWEVEYWSKDIINYSDEILVGGNNVRVNEYG